MLFMSVFVVLVKNMFVRAARPECQRPFDIKRWCSVKLREPDALDVNSHTRSSPVHASDHRHWWTLQSLPFDEERRTKTHSSSSDRL